MARVKVLINNSNVKVISTEVNREGERAIDQSQVVLPASSAACVSDEITILQDAVDLCNIIGAYLMQGGMRDESGLCNNAFGSVSRPRVDTQLLWCVPCGIPNNFGVREITVTDLGNVTCVAGKVGVKAMCFDGTCDYITYAEQCIFGIDQTTQLSTSFWIKSSDVSVPIVSKKATATTDKGWEIGLDACGRVEFRITNTATTNELRVRGDTAVNTCVWTHVAVTYNGVPGCGGSAVDIYINGDLDTKGVITNNLTGCTLNASVVTYGAYADGSTKFTGALDDGCIWVSLRLTEEEVRSVYNVGILEEVTGRTGHSIRFNGVDTFQEIPYTTDFDFTGQFDIMVWARWQGTTNQYFLARRTLSGNGFAISSNRLATGDIVAEIDGNLIKTCGESFNDFNWHFIRVNRDSSNVVHLSVDNVEKNTAVVASNLTLVSPPMMVGTNHNKTAYFTGDIDVIRMYNTSLGTISVDRIYNDIVATSIMKFGGHITKITKEIITKKVIAQSYGDQLGIVEVRAAEYNNKTPEFIIDDIIRSNTCLDPHIHGQCSGLILKIFNADGKIIDIVRDLSQLIGKTFHTDALKRFHLHETAFNNTCFVFEHGVCARNFECVNDDTEIVNDLVVIGETKKYDTICSFSGDGVETQFQLDHGSTSINVKISGTEKVPEQDYNYCLLNKTITFTCAPACGACNIVVEYQYELPLLIRGQKQSSIDINGRHSKRLVMPWIRTRNDGIRFINGYLNRFKEIRASLKLELGVMKNSLTEGDVVRVINNIKNIDNTFVVKSLTWVYPEMKTNVLLGEFKFDDLEYEKQIIEKLHDLESAITEIKDLRCSEQLEEILALTDGFNIIEGALCGTVFVETLSLTDGITITVVSPGIYNQSTYNGGDIYGTNPVPGGFTCSGFTCSGFTVVPIPSAYATGGCVVQCGIYRIHTFTTSGNICFSIAGPVEYLIVAGGGGGGSSCTASSGGGGGGGGVRYGSNYCVSINCYNVTVGDGGTGATGGAGTGTDGCDSSVFCITASGGGRGASTIGGAPAAGNGGSGGGGAGSPYSTSGGTGNCPSVCPSQGSNGGTGFSGGGNAGGGGGGATVIGSNGTTSYGGDGGCGYTSDINGTCDYYGCGGGGGVTNSGIAGGTGGLGNGGNGRYSSGNGDPGVAGTGGGGGGSGLFGDGGNGGKGVIIIKYISAL